MSMHLERIEIENFKGVGERQTIELEPITLLFGSNSAGKSTILQALHYMREILERGNIDPDVTIAGGLIDLGGFSMLVHNHELHRVIRLKLSLDLSDEQGTNGLPLNAGLSFGEPEFSELPIRYLLGESDEYHDYAIIQRASLEIEIGWSELERAPYVARFAVELDDALLAAIVSPPQTGRAQLTEFNFSHPLLQRALPPDERADLEIDQPPLPSPLEDEIWSLAREAAADRSTVDTPDDKLRIAVDTVIGALPDLARELALDIRDPEVKKAELEEHTPRVNGLRRLLTELILGPARLIRDYLSGMTYIGPLREIPSRSYRPQVTPDEARWASGLAAWDLLYTDRKGELMLEVNDWLSDESRLRTGHRLERVEFKEVPVPSLFHQMFERGLTEDDLGELQELYLSLRLRTEIALRDFQKGILVAPGDVGVGISQMVPVVVAALRKRGGILAIEQPELHIHPAIQVGIGDLFIRAVRADPDRLFANKTLLIETHSEHIMLRLLRRIREQTENELPPGVDGLSVEDLSVIYVEAGDQGVRFRPLKVDKDGEFRDQWPNGFFEERAEELF
jgi:predicted ATPase